MNALYIGAQVVILLIALVALYLARKPAKQDRSGLTAFIDRCARAEVQAERMEDRANDAERRLQWMLDWWFGSLKHLDSDAIGQCLSSEELLAYIDKETST